MKPWKTVVLGAFALSVLCSCSNAVGTIVPPNADEKTDAASRNYVRCLRDGADRYDDEKTSIDEVVARVSSLCASQYSALKDTYARDLDSNSLLAFETEMDANRLAGVRDVILHRRQTRPSTVAASANGPD